jgi:hypothetical protein
MRAVVLIKNECLPPPGLLSKAKKPMFIATHGEAHQNLVQPVNLLELEPPLTSILSCSSPTCRESPPLMPLYAFESLALATVHFTATETLSELVLANDTVAERLGLL